MKLENCEIKQYGCAFLTAPEAAQLLHISTSHAYKVIHQLNQELKALLPGLPANHPHPAQRHLQPCGPLL